MTPYRILVTGSRTWADAGAVQTALARAAESVPAGRELVVVHGDCPRGADAMADLWARQYGAAIERHPADWQRHGKAAGPRRNSAMVDLGADLVLAFIRDGSRGATHCALLAEQAGIPVRRFTA
ncbi:DUF2493 domain-containing protein [Streptomyces eurythermus]